MPKPLLEMSLLSPVLRHLRRRKFRTLLTEVPFYDYRIDVFGFSATQNLTVAIELKLENWRRAFQQALIYQLCADLSFVAMPQANVSRLDLGLFAANGVGVIGVSLTQGCRAILPAVSSAVVRPHYRSDLVHLLKEFA